jgi:hypothetical protein
LTKNVYGAAKEIIRTANRSYIRARDKVDIYIANTLKIAQATNPAQTYGIFFNKAGNAARFNIHTGS